MRRCWQTNDPVTAVALAVGLLVIPLRLASLIHPSGTATYTYFPPLAQLIVIAVFAAQMWAAAFGSWRVRQFMALVALGTSGAVVAMLLSGNPHSAGAWWWAGLACVQAWCYWRLRERRDAMRDVMRNRH